MAGDIDFQAVLESISDERARHGFRLLLNLVEELVADNQALRELVQQQRDEINRLKGEQGKPHIKPNKPDKAAAVEAAPDASTDHSSEKERRKPKDWKKRAKLSEITVDREQTLSVDPSTLPDDAVRKGYEEVIVQDLVVKTDNILFRKEKWYSPGAHKTFIAELPPGYHGAFGPKLKALALSLSFGTNISQPKLLEFFRNAGVIISAGSLSGMLMDVDSSFESSVHPTGEHSRRPTWQEEYDALFRAGLNSSLWQGTDHTSTRVNGVAHQCQVVGNSLYSIYATTPSGNRANVLDVLLNRVHRNIPRTYLLNAEAHQYLEAFKFSGVIYRTLHEMPQEQFIPEPEFLKLLEERLPQLGDQQFNQVIDAAAIAAYHEQREWPIVHLLLSDDAPVFKGVTEEMALCWVHAGRHYKKLTPFLGLHRTLLNNFSTQLWDYYHELLLYQKHPTPEERDRLSQKFDKIFEQITGYGDLDKRIAMTKAKKESLLKALKYPELPLHNNDSELSARARVRKRDVSFGPRTKAGARAWDIFMSLYVTARKLGVSFYHYLLDRISQSYEMPSLATLIEQNTPAQISAIQLAAA